MFERPHHQRVVRVLEALDRALLERTQTWFAGGTASSLLLGEYRESVDADFLCSSTDGYRELRTRVFEQGLAGLTSRPLEQLRDLRADQYGVRTWVQMDGVPIKLEFVREARVELEGQFDDRLPVPVLCRRDLVVEKLLANVDRVMDRATFNRDALDLGMMLAAWGLPAGALDRATSAYGAAVARAVEQARDRLGDDAWRAQCLAALQMSPDDGAKALAALSSVAPR